MSVDFHKSTMLKATIDQLAKAGMVEHGAIFLEKAEEQNLFTSKETAVKV
tara:strand:+ start:1221 stop:1370 length:150 start_codon:yes stop_codon:yes gene_type:complete